MVQNSVSHPPETNVENPSQSCTQQRNDTPWSPRPFCRSPTDGPLARSLASLLRHIQAGLPAGIVQDGEARALGAQEHRQLGLQACGSRKKKKTSEGMGGRLPLILGRGGEGFLFFGGGGGGRETGETAGGGKGNCLVSREAAGGFKRNCLVVARDTAWCSQGKLLVVARETAWFQGKLLVVLRETAWWLQGTLLGVRKGNCWWWQGRLPGFKGSCWWF